MTECRFCALSIFWGGQSTLRQGGVVKSNDGVSILRIVDYFEGQSTLRQGGVVKSNDGVSTHSCRTVIAYRCRIGAFKLGNFLSTMRHSIFSRTPDVVSIFPEIVFSACTALAAQASARRESVANYGNALLVQVTMVN